MRFLRKGAVAIDPKAFGAYGIDYTFSDQPQQEAELFTDDVAYVTIRGPLSHHEEWWFESYDAIVMRMREAFASSAKVVFVSGDTPGGDVSGCFDTARELRRLADESGKLFVWYVDGQTCSAGLALAMAADVIVVPEEGRFGSIGVIAEVHSISKALAARGEDVRLITSGERKADGHPCNAITEEVEEAIKESVLYEAEIFFQWVSERRGIPVETIRSWQAGIFHGQQAVDVGLADEVAGESAALAMVAGAELTDAPTGAESDADMKPQSLAASARAALGLPAPKASVASRAEDGDDFDAVKKKLGKIASGSDAKKAARAAEMLKKMAEDSSAEEEEPKKDPEHEEPDGDEGGKKAAAAETEEGATAADTEEEEEEASAATSAESDDDAKKCEDDAKKAEAEAGDEDAKARAALSSSAKDASKTALRHMNRASFLRNRAVELRGKAKMLNTIATQSALIVGQGKAIDTLTKRVAKLGQPNPSVAAMGATGTRGRGESNAKTPETIETGAEVIDLSIFTPKELSQLHLGTKHSGLVEVGGTKELGLLSPDEAQAIVTATEKRVAQLRGGA